MPKCYTKAQENPLHPKQEQATLRKRPEYGCIASGKESCSHRHSPNLSDNKRHEAS